MRVLRFVGPDVSPGRVVVETLDGEKQFSLELGESLHMTIETAPLSAVSTGSSVPDLSPREIQMRTRAGESPESLAESSGMALDKVLRFARPVLEERTRITVEARRARARQSTPEGQLVSFGDCVDRRFAEHGIDPAQVSWDAYRRDDAVWVVSAGWLGGDTERIARWAVSLTHRLVSPLDETASDLLSDRPIRPVVHVVPALEPEVEADIAAEQLDLSENLTGPLPEPIIEEVFDQEADSDTPALPLRLADPVKRSGRQQVPAWDDILLGVRRTTD